MSEKGESRVLADQVALSREFFGVVQNWTKISGSPALHSDSVLDTYEQEFAQLLSKFSDENKPFYWSKLPQRFKLRVTAKGTVKDTPRSTILK